MELKTAEQMNRPLTGESKLTPIQNPDFSTTETPSTEIPKEYLPPKVKHPLRFGIHGITDKIADLKQTIQDSELADGLKNFLCDELDKMKSNAAEIHLHDVERSDGGFDLHVSLKAVVLGVRKNAITKTSKVD